jgi:hypothetical protein
MGTMNTVISRAQEVWEYIKRDYREYPARFYAEVFSWACSVTSAVIFAATVPTVPVVPLYTIFISGCCAAAWTCWTRGSFGLLANYVFLIVIDCVGLIRMLYH